MKVEHLMTLCFLANHIYLFIPIIYFQHLAIYRQLVFRMQRRRVMSTKILEDIGVKADLAESMMSKFQAESFIKPRKK